MSGVYKSHLSYSFTIKTSFVKRLVYLLIVLLPAAGWAQQHSLQLLWQTDSIVAVPESVLPDYDKNILYVSLIDGGGWDADGKGGVGRLSMDGKQYDSIWISG